LAIALLVEIYIDLLPLSDIPYRTFSVIPGINLEALKEFGVNLLTKKVLKEKITFAKSFLNDIIGVNDFNRSLRFLRSSRRKNISQ
jgi:hypothetical protein